MNYKWNLLFKKKKKYGSPFLKLLINFNNNLFYILDEVPDGQTPHSVSLCCYEDLVDTAKPGDRYKQYLIKYKMIQLYKNSTIIFIH